MKRNAILRLLIDVAIFLMAAAATWLAQSLDRPITAVLAFLFGVILIAVHSGLTAAIIAAATASLAYNFFLSHPAFELGITTADEAVPLIAFNVCALLAAMIVGKLKDAANSAQSAQDETAFLLMVSDRLQRAIKIEEIEAEMRELLHPRGIADVEIFLADEGDYARPSSAEIKPGQFARSPEADQAFPAGPATLFHELRGAHGTLGRVEFRMADGASDDLGAGLIGPIAGLLALAIERCVLLDKVAEAQAIEKGEELKDTILSSVSHDLRTPITAIKTAASALASDQVKLGQSDRKAMLLSIEEQCRRLDRYTTALLDVGQIHSGISKSAFDIIELVEIVGFATKHASSAHPENSIDRALPNGPIFVRANAAMLEQAIFNLLDNACKFAGASGPITVELEESENAAIVTVKDLGPGVAERDRPRLFERSFKSNHAGVQTGSGLGLYIAKGFVEAFEGNVAVSQRKDGKQGAEFRITLPKVPMVPDLKVVA